MNKEVLNSCIDDLKKINEAQLLLKDIKNSKSIDNIEPYLKYILENNIIKTLEDVFYIITKHPDISEKLSEAVKKYGLNDLKNNSSANSYNNYEYSGTYNRLQDAPGYGTDWNERCIPDNVSIRSKGTCRC